MEYLVVIAIAIAIAIFDDRVRGRKKVPPPTVPQDIPRPKKRAAQQGSFEIPPLRGALQIAIDAEVLRAQELRARWEEQRREAQRAKRIRARAERLAAEQADAAAIQCAVPRTAATLLPQLTPHTMQQAIVLAEVLGKPRALRRFPRR